MKNHFSSKIDSIYYPQIGQQSLLYIFHSFRILCLSKHFQSPWPNLMKKTVNLFRRRYVIFLNWRAISVLILMIASRKFPFLFARNSILFALYVWMIYSKVSHTLKNVQHAGFIYAKTQLLWTRPCLEFVIEFPYLLIISFKNKEKGVKLSKKLWRQSDRLNDWSISQKMRKSKTSILKIENKKEFFQN